MTFDSFRRARRNRLHEFVTARLRCVEKEGFFTRLQSAFTLLSARFGVQMRERVFLIRKTPLVPGYFKQIVNRIKLASRKRVLSSLTAGHFENGRWSVRRIWTCHLLPRLRIVAEDFAPATRL